MLHSKAETRNRRSAANVDATPNENLQRNSQEITKTKPKIYPKNIHKMLGDCDVETWKRKSAVNAMQVNRRQII